MTPVFATGFAGAPFAPGSRALGIGLAVLSVILPALPLGPLAAQPPLPLAAAWLAHGWASGREAGWQPPAILFALGLLQDQLSGGPMGLMAAYYLIAFLASAAISSFTRSLTVVTDVVGFAASMALATLVTLAVSRFALTAAPWTPLLLSVAVTLALYPLVRGLYVRRSAAAQGMRG